MALRVECRCRIVPWRGKKRKPMRSAGHWSGLVERVTVATADKLKLTVVLPADDRTKGITAGA